MSKALIFSDLHAHCHKKSADRLSDCLGALRWVFQTAISRNIKDIIFAGDLFHDRQKIDVFSYQTTFNVFQEFSELNPAPNVWLLIGNHDMWFNDKWTVSSVKPLNALQNVTVIDRPSVLQIGGVNVGFLPYTKDPLTDIQKVGDCDTLFAHLAIDGAYLNLRYRTKSETSVEHDGEMVKVSPEIFRRFKQVFLGHYHAAQQIGDNAEYIGSPLELSFGEAEEEKHIIVYDLKTGEKEYVKNDFSPVHIYYDGKTGLKIKRKSFINILTDDASAPSNIEIQKELQKHPDVLEVKIKPIRKKVSEETSIIENAKAILYDERKMAEKYIEEISPDNLDRKILLQVFNAIRTRKEQT